MTGPKKFAAIMSVLLMCTAARAQNPGNATPALPVQHLNLAQARQTALQNHPQLLEARSIASAANEVTTEVRSAYYPSIYGNFTGVEAESDSRVTAGGLNNPIIYDRYANGVEVRQMVTDFGRTHNLAASAQAQSKAAQQGVEVTRQSVLLGVENAYFAVLKTQAVLKVAEQTTQERQVVVNQVTELTKNRLKSGLDLSFAQVNLSQAQLLLTSAQNNLESSYADLTMALGYSDHRAFDLEEPAASDAVLPPMDESLNAAFQNRPELAQQRYNVEAAKRFATAERDLYFPRLDALAVAGITPYGQSQLTDRYAAAGFNLNLPIFEGRLFSARHAEANFRAQGQTRQFQLIEDQIARDLKRAWLNANTARQNLDLSQQLVTQADKALDLAQARYKLGLSSIVELSEAELNDSQAQIQAVTARYDYRISLVQLDYQEGVLR